MSIYDHQQSSNKIYVEDEGTRYGSGISCFSIRSRSPNTVTVDELQIFVDKFIQLNNEFINDKDNKISKFHNGELCYCVWFNGEDFEPKLPDNVEVVFSAIISNKSKSLSHIKIN